jgi:hypothetical protein
VADIGIIKIKIKRGAAVLFICHPSIRCYMAKLLKAPLNNPYTTIHSSSLHGNKIHWTVFHSEPNFFLSHFVVVLVFQKIKVKGCRHPCSTDPQHTRKYSQWIHRRHEENSFQDWEEVSTEHCLLLMNAAGGRRWLHLRVAALRLEGSAYCIYWPTTCF